MSWIVIAIVVAVVAVGLAVVALRRARPSWDQTDAMGALRRMSTGEEPPDRGSAEES